MHHPAKSEHVDEAKRLRLGVRQGSLGREPFAHAWHLRGRHLDAELVNGARLLISAEEHEDEVVALERDHVDGDPAPAGFGPVELRAQRRPASFVLLSLAKQELHTEEVAIEAFRSLEVGYEQRNVPAGERGHELDQVSPFRKPRIAADVSSNASQRTVCPPGTITT